MTPLRTLNLLAFQSPEDKLAHPILPGFIEMSVMVTLPPPLYAVSQYTKSRPEPIFSALESSEARKPSENPSGDTAPSGDEVPYWY